MVRLALISIASTLGVAATTTDAAVLQSHVTATEHANERHLDPDLTEPSAVAVEREPAGVALAMSSPANNTSRNSPFAAVLELTNQDFTRADAWMGGGDVLVIDVSLEPVPMIQPGGSLLLSQLGR